MNRYDEASRIMTERFHRDKLIAVATVDGTRPYVRTVNGFYEDGAFYVVTHARSNKMQQIKKNPEVAVCGEWFTGHGTGENLGHVLDERNAARMNQLRPAFAEWYAGGHVDESDPHTCILRIRMATGVLLSNGTRYEIDFANETVNS